MTRKFTPINFLIMFFLIVSVIKANLEVVSITPEPNSMSSDKNTMITVQFNKRINPASVTDTSFMVYGRWSGVITGNISYNSIGTAIFLMPDNTFNSGEVVSVSISKNLLADDGDSLNTGYSCNFWIKPNDGVLQLAKKEEISVRQPGEGWIQTYGAFAGDLNEDGFTDFTVPNENTNDVRVFLNDGNGGYNDFTVNIIANGSKPSTNEGADFDLDGHMDFAVGNSQNNNVTVFQGNGLGQLVQPMNYTVGSGVRGLSVMDLNSDGFADLVTANRNGSNYSLLINSGDGTFTNIGNFDTGSSGETACAAADANNDGVMDLFIGALNSEEMILLLGDGVGGLNFSSKVDAGGACWMIAVGDVNNDGNVDVVSANSSSNNVSVIKGDGGGNLMAAEIYSFGEFPISIDLGDIDGDGDLDMVSSNYSSANFIVFENTGNGEFENRFQMSTSGAGSCVVLHDRDNDGDLDITGIDELEDILILYNNDPSLVDVKDAVTVNEFLLSQNYPNPFNPTTTIKYSIPISTFVTLKVYDVLGNEVASLVNEEKFVGNYEADFGAKSLANGIYFYTLEASNYTDTKKMVLLK